MAYHKITHCNHWWTVEEAIELAPTPDRPNLKAQVFIWAMCKAFKGHKKPQPVYRWYGIRKDGSLTEQSRITENEFNAHWLPRLLTDVKQADKPTRMMMFVSEHTRRSNRPADSAMVYLDQKRWIADGLLEKPGRA